MLTTIWQEVLPVVTAADFPVEATLEGATPGAIPAEVIQVEVIREAAADATPAVAVEAAAHTVMPMAKQ